MLLVTLLKKIGNKTLKIVNTSLSLAITKIFNSIIKSGLYPSRLKIANVIPLFKLGNKKEIQNYRPISSLNCINTVIEKLLYNRLESFF